MSRLGSWIVRVVIGLGCFLIGVATPGSFWQGLGMVVGVVLVAVGSAAAFSLEARKL